MRSARRFFSVPGLVPLFVVSVAAVQAQPCGVPTIATISPDNVEAGVPFTIDVSGTGFFAASMNLPGSTILLNNTPLTTTFVSPTQLTGDVPAGLTQVPGAGIAVLNCPGVVSTPLTLIVGGPPTLNVSPASFTFNYTAGSNSTPAAQTVNITSSGAPIAFTATAATSSGGNWLTVGPASGTTPASLNIGVSNLSNLAPGTYNGSVVIASPQAANSPVAIPVTLIVVGTIAASPASFTFNYTAGSNSTPAAQTVNITSSGVPIAFTATAATSSGGNWLTVGPASGTTPASLNIGVSNLSNLAPGTYNGSVVIASPQAANSPVTIAVTLLVTPPVVTIRSVDPSSATAGGLDFILTVTGNGIQNTSKVFWNGSPLNTTYVNAMLLTAMVPGGLIATPGLANIFVEDPIQVAAGLGGPSNTLVFTIDFPPPTIGSLVPTTVTACDPSFILKIDGTAFRQGSTIQWNGSPLPTTFVSATQLTATITPDLIAKAGSAAITVINPDNAASNMLTFVVTACQPVITGLSPPSIVAGNPAFAVAVSGSGFAPNAVVLLNSSQLVTRFDSSNQLTASVTANLLITVGCLTITVRNADGSVSPPTSFCVTTPPPPSFFIGGPSISGPVEQPTVDFGLNAQYALPIDVTVTLAFTSEAIVPSDDLMIQLGTGCRTFSFTIPANTTTVPILMVQTGTVAGTITVHLSAQVAGSQFDVGDALIHILRSAPVIFRPPQLTITPAGFEVSITGFSPERAMTKAVFHFNPSPGSTIQFPDIAIDVGGIFTSWYAGSSSAQFVCGRPDQSYGSLFTYIQPFTVQNGPASIKSVTVTLMNSSGPSAPATSQ